MHVSHLELSRFRNYEQASVDLQPGTTLFVGRNGQGKTNLVEAIGFLATLSSHRVSSDTALVQRDADTALIRATLRHGERAIDLDVSIPRSGANRARVNGRAVRARDLPRYINTVLFAPEDLQIVRGDPAARRRFFDGLLAQRSPRTATLLAEYERVVRQRNSLLKALRQRESAHGSSADALAIWDDQLVELGTVLIIERLRLAAELTPRLADAYARLVGENHGAGITMKVTALGHRTSSVGDDQDDASTTDGGDITPNDIREQFTTQLRERRSAELERAITLVGPHRDDAVLWLNRLPARMTASHGESWSFALAAKLAAADLVRSASLAGDPILILDDVFAELDARRRRRLGEAIGDFEQVLITAAVLDDVPPTLRQQALHIRAGVVSRLRDGKDPADPTYPADPHGATEREDAHESRD